MKVVLLEHTPNPEKVIATAAKLCYSNSNVNELMDNLTEDKIEQFINMLTEIGHESPIEHVTFTFGIEGVSRSLLAQITRHRIASFSVQSQRYVKVDDFKYVIPPAIQNNLKCFIPYEKLMNNVIKVYNQIADELETQYIVDGMDKKSAEKKAIEDARFVLPNASETKLVITINARSLFNFFRLRCCNRAQWEIQAVADEMLKLCKEVAPTLFKNAGASCVVGKCLEGKMSCGKKREM